MALRSCLLLLVTVGLLAAAAAASYGDHEEKRLRCYHCTSDHYNPNCDDPFNSTGIEVVDCLEQTRRRSDPREVPVCKKIKQRINNGDLQTVRSCAVMLPDQSCTTTDQSSYIHEEYCITCDTDLCNAASPLAAAAAAIFTPLLAALLA
uniref:Ly-6/neurotoxin 2 n=1 Tax=Locusta migratoria TaxID=7004 RepID=A0A0G3I6K7_LOCMI|nr:Ly-6/neurotoxin 2 [Locusta migratoria]